MHRRIIATLAWVLASLAVASAALAGGWATIVPDEAVSPTAGQPTEIGFTVMQHGKTPTSSVTPSVVVANSATQALLMFPARQSGKTGHFVATITIPSAGAHTWAVTLPELIVEAKPVPFVVSADPAGAPSGPTVVDDTATGAAADLARLRSELTVMRIAIVGLAAALAGVGALALAMAFARRRPSPTVGDPVSDAI